MKSKSKTCFRCEGTNPHCVHCRINKLPYVDKKKSRYDWLFEIWQKLRKFQNRTVAGVLREDNGLLVRDDNGKTIEITMEMDNEIIALFGDWRL